MESTKFNLSTISSKFTEEILFEIIKTNYKKKIDTDVPNILNYSVNYATSEGDSYIGGVYRITVTLVNGRVISLIGKCMPANLARRKLFQCTEFFAKEHLFYNKIVPVLNEFEINQRGSKQFESNSLLDIPKCYYSLSDSENDFLVLEDLQEDNYAMLDRTLGLNVPQSISIVKMFARFHGLSLAMQNLCPDKFKEISSNIIEPLFRVDQECWMRNKTKIANIFLNAINEELKGTIYLDKFINFIKPDYMHKILIEFVELNHSPSVICHGDVWITNFMFQNSTNHVKAVDFQMLRYGSPMLDLSTVIFSCTTSEEREKVGGVNGMIDIYHDELHQTVTLLGAPESSSLSRSQLQDLWKQLGAFGFGCAVTLVPISVVDSADVGDLDGFDVNVACEKGVALEDVITQFKDIRSDNGRKRLVETVKFAVHEGLI